MNKNLLISVSLVVIMALVAVGFKVDAFSGASPSTVVEHADNVIVQAGAGDSENLGFATGDFFSYVKAWAGLTVVGTLTAEAVNTTGAVDMTGATKIDSLTSGNGALQLATSTGTTNISAAQLLADSYLEITVNTGATASIQLPATSTWTTIIPDVGDTRNWVIHNATSSTMAMTILAGTGMDLIGVTTNDDVIDATEYAELECWRQPDTDVTCRVSELLHVD